MNYRMILAMMGLILTLIGLSMLFPALLSLLDGDRDWVVFGVAGLLGVLSGILLYMWGRFQDEGDIKTREAFMIVVLTWVLASVYGAVPYVGTGAMARFSDAFFESMSGFTTTGATVLSDIESLNRGILLWRAMTHWLGGLGIISLFVALMSFLGQSSQHVFLRETTGPIKEKLAPKVKETAAILWRIYIIFTITQVLLLMLFGMDWFDSVCHSFSTMGTGGFSTKNASLGHYTHSGIYWVTALFMAIGGVNFGLIFQAFQKRNPLFFWKNGEFRLYVTILGMTILVVGTYLWINGDTLLTALRDAVFQVVSIMTTTGFIVRDFDIWAPAVQLIFFMLMLVGGCSGSTGGGMKVGRIQLLFAQIRLEMRQALHARAILSAKVDLKPVSHEIMLRVLTFIALYGLVIAFGTLIMTLFDLDLISAVTAVITCVSNAGPGLNRVGPTQNFSFIPDLGKSFLSFIMVLGRLELYTILVLFTPDFWSKK
jgi:trk system potassium uptake protein TrkH